MNDNKVFLGGTYGKSNWREELVRSLDVAYFNPIVDDWTEKCQQIEIHEKETQCNIHAYVITNDMEGVFSIAEVVDSVHQQSKVTVLQVQPRGFNSNQLRSLEAVVNLVSSRGGIAYIDNDLMRLARVLNYSFSTKY